MKLTPISSLTTTSSASSHCGSETVLRLLADLIIFAHVIWERVFASMSYFENQRRFIEGKEDSLRGETDSGGIFINDGTQRGQGER
jgi:hypothetical protein